MIGKPHRATVDLRLEPRPARRPLDAAQLEDVGEVGAEQDRQVEVDRRSPIVLQLEHLEECAVHQHLAPLQGDGIALHDHFAAAALVEIAQIAHQLAGVVGGCGAEQEREITVQPQLEPVEESRAAAEQPVGLAAGQGNVAGLVEHGEAVAVIQQQATAARRQRRRQQIVVVADADAFRTFAHQRRRACDIRHAAPHRPPAAYGGTIAVGSRRPVRVPETGTPAPARIDSYTST